MFRSRPRVLLLIEQPFSGIPNGGSTVYGKLIASNPAIDFVVLGRNAFLPAGSPRNVSVIHMSGRQAHSGLNGMIQAASGLQFDAVDCPDWHSPTPNLKRQLTTAGIRTRRIVVGLHGASSRVAEHDPSGSMDPLRLALWRKGEAALYSIADASYGLSPEYAAQLPLGGTFFSLDPLWFMKMPMHKESRSSAHRHGTCSENVGSKRRVAATFLGRQEGTKGFSVFCDLAADASETDMNFAAAGPGAFSWREYVYFDRRKNLLPTPLVEDRSFGASEMSEVLTDTGRVFVTPSLFDSFNLSAAEAALHGARVVISDAVPALRWLQGLPGSVEVTSWSSRGSTSDLRDAIRRSSDVEPGVLTRNLQLGIELHANAKLSLNYMLGVYVG